MSMPVGLAHPPTYALCWEYVHSFMHGAGYALDPEFMGMEMDTAVSNGVMEVIERICLRDVLRTAETEEGSEQR